MAIFISYSRKDSDFVRRLHGGLAENNRDTWVDWEGIPPTAEWMVEIEAAIDAAEAFVFVLSPDSAASAVCRRELAHAAAQNKRLIPIVCRDVDADGVPEALSKLNWIFFRPADDFLAAVGILLTAVDTDLEWVHAHSRLLVRAREWDAKAHDTSLALRGGDLKSAEQWLTLGPTKEPKPTELQTRYIIDSRRVATNRRFALLGGTTVGLVIVAVLGTMFYFQRQEAARQQTIAVARRLTSAAEMERDQIPRADAEIGPREQSLQLATEATRRLQGIGFHSLEADLAMRRGLPLLPRRIRRLTNDAGTAQFDDIVFGADNRMVAASAEVLATEIWDPVHYEHSAGAQGKSGANQVALNPDGRFLATIGYDHVEGAIDVWDAQTLESIANLRDLGTVSGLALGPNATYLAATTEEYDQAMHQWSNGVTRLWELPSRREIARLPPAVALSFSPDGNYLAGVVNQTTGIWNLLDLGTSATPEFRSLVSDAGGPKFSPDGKYLAVSIEDGVRIWSTADWKMIREAKIKTSDAWAVSPGSRYLLGPRDADEEGNTVSFQVIDTLTNEEVARITANRVRAAAFGHDGRNIAIGSYPALELWQIIGHGSDTVRIAAGPETDAIAFSADETHLLVFSGPSANASIEFSAKVWDFAPDPQPSSLDLGPSVTAFAVSADGRSVAVALAGKLRIIDSTSGITRRSFSLAGTTKVAALSPEGDFLVAATDAAEVHVWQSEPPKEIADFKLPDRSAITRLAVSPGATNVIAVSSGKITRSGVPVQAHVWQSPFTTEVAAVSAGHDRSGFQTDVCALSADGRYLAAGGRILDPHTGQTVFSAPAGSPCAFSSDGEYLAAAGDGETVRIWSIKDQEEVARIERVPDLHYLAFSPRGKYLATLQKGGDLRVWLLRYEDLAAEACSRLTRNMTRSEWREYFGDQAYHPTCPQLPVPEIAEP